MAYLIIILSGWFLRSGSWNINEIQISWNTPDREKAKQTWTRHSDNHGVRPLLCLASTAFTFKHRLSHCCRNIYTNSIGRPTTYGHKRHKSNRNPHNKCQGDQCIATSLSDLNEKNGHTERCRRCRSVTIGYGQVKLQNLLVAAETKTSLFSNLRAKIVYRFL